MTGLPHDRDEEVEALVVDRYLESLLARRPHDVEDVPVQLEATAYRRKLARVLGAAAAAPLRTARAALDEVQHYLAVKVVLSLVCGVALGLWCWAWGVPNPLLWGVIAFLLRRDPTEAAS